MGNVIGYVEDKKSSEFYPTPEELVDRMLKDVDFNHISTILEPSAGKGDILQGIARKLNSSNYSNREIEVDAIELDANLRAILKYNFSEEHESRLKDEMDAIAEGKRISWDYASDSALPRKIYTYYNRDKNEYIPFSEEKQKQLTAAERRIDSHFKYDECVHVIHDDFFTFEPFQNYDLIVMNPPFSNGDKHLLKALSLQRNRTCQLGGQIICLLNAETIRNPFTASRKELVRLLEEYNADIEYVKNAFSHSERQTDVEIAIINVTVPPMAETEPSIYDRLKKAEQYEEPSFEECTELEVTDFIKAIVNRYRMECKAGVELIHTYQRMLPHISTTFDGSLPIIELKDHEGHYMGVNSYLKAVRRKYWQELLSNPKFVGKLTSTLQNKYHQKLGTFIHYDFSEFNIYELIKEMNVQIKTGIEDEIDKMYERLTIKHSDNEDNVYLYSGWKTNKAWKIDKKSIIPCYGVFDSWFDTPRTYEAYSTLADIERILNFFDGNMTADVDLERQLKICFSQQPTKNMRWKASCKFFEVTFYKKGTVHIVYTCPELIDRFNIYVGKRMKWLPPSYGKKKYDDMSAEEKAVIDSFHEDRSTKGKKKVSAKETYEKIMQRPEYYLAPPTSGAEIPLLGVSYDAEDNEERSA